MDIFSRGYQGESDWLGTKSDKYLKHFRDITGSKNFVNASELFRVISRKVREEDALSRALSPQRLAGCTWRFSERNIEHLSRRRTGCAKLLAALPGNCHLVSLGKRRSITRSLIYPRSFFGTTIFVLHEYLYLE